MLYTYKEIKTVHLEITDKCNAACPMCARNINGGEDNPQLPGTELFIEDIKRIFKKILEQIQLHGQSDESKHQLIEEYADCLLRMSKAFKTPKPFLINIRQELHILCVNFMEDFLANRVMKYPGISKKASFSFMDCLDIFKP